MKNFSFILLFLFGMLLTTQAQYITPGNSQAYTLDDLVDLSGGTVSFENGSFIINNALTISATDTLKITEATVLKIAAGLRPEFFGSIISNPENGEVIITAVDTITAGQGFDGLRFEDSQANYIANTRITHGGGIQLIESEATFEYCTFIHNSSSNTSSVISYSNCSPIIRYCRFVENERSAIGSGANTEGSPQIYFNEFIHNTNDNSNRPQLNLGPGAVDSIYIVGNYVEGFNDNAGGISISSLVGVGNTKAVVSGNTIVNNRYGYAQIGNNISSRISDNILAGNNIQNDPMLGGSGLNFYGTTTTNKAIIRNNIISGNLWGITTQEIVDINLGTAMNPGGNVFYENGNTGETYAFYNNTAEDVSAIGNYWGTNDLAIAETYIFHQPDDGTLGLVTYEPIKTLEPEFLSFDLLALNNPQLENNISGTVNPDNFTVTLEVPAGISLTNLIPTYTVELGISGDPASEVAQDFNENVVYTLSTPHGSEAEWTVIANQQSATYDLTFMVEDEEGLALAGAEITLEGIGTQSTNDSGISVFESLEPGTYTYEVLVEAYEAVNGSVEMIDEDLTELVVMDIFVNLAEAKTEAIQIYPNPVQDILQIKGLTAESNTIKILDLQGKVVFETRHFSANSIHVNHLSRGEYVLIVENNDTVQKLKFIKK
ncbi:MAG: T9SS type A sorting domain-containing protein [Bacteroidetes bacterium]|nr:T9SS type A sorting domain-containing protein [Bacteroidota bacterium]MBU1579337.1 T9SS type A sorting domain-containing protein [Bacteroidota bacterium]MBU2558435.1 T9SS type A sorting domain-containing protein [Bacteroidota bacterium]